MWYKTAWYDVDNDISYTKFVLDPQLFIEILLKFEHQSGVMQLKLEVLKTRSEIQDAEMLLKQVHAPAVVLSDNDKLNRFHMLSDMQAYLHSIWFISPFNLNGFYSYEFANAEVFLRASTNEVERAWNILLVLDKYYPCKDVSDELVGQCGGQLLMQRAARMFSQAARDSDCVFGKLPDEINFKFATSMTNFFSEQARGKVVDRFWGKQLLENDDKNKPGM